ncbi:MAG: M56 family metallopeptidase [Asticcacaulis sp.]
MIIAFMIAMAWKSALVTTVGLAIAWLVRGHSAAARVAVLRVTAALVLVLPLLALLLPALRIQTGPTPPPILLPASLPSTFTHIAAAPHAALDWRLVLAAVYAGGLVLCLIRLLADVTVLAFLSATARPVEDPVWRQALHRVCAPIRSRLRVSKHIKAPLSWGLRPVILLNPGALDRPGDAAAVLAHEAGHIQRRDWLFLMLSRLTAAVFWFNPLVWWLQHELEQRSEEAVDAFAVARVDRTAYASALVGFAGRATPGAANGMAKGTLKRRIGLILKDQRTVRAAPLLTGVAGLACVAFATPLAAVELVQPQAEVIQAAPATDPDPAAPAVPAPAVPAPAVAPEGTEKTITLAGDPDAQALAAKTEAEQQAQDDQQAKQDAEQAGRDAQQAQQDDQQAQRDADQAKRDAEQSNRDAEQAKRDQERDAAQASRDAAQAARDAGHAQRDADRAKGQAQFDKAASDQARQAGEVAKAQALAQKLAGADQMDAGVMQMQKGAQELRQEAVNLGDPAYRAKQIADAAARGQTITDDKLQALIPEFRQRADDMDQRAIELQARAADMRNAGG